MKGIVMRRRALLIALMAIALSACQTEKRQDRSKIQEPTVKSYPSKVLEGKVKNLLEQYFSSRRKGAFKKVLEIVHPKIRGLWRENRSSLEAYWEEEFLHLEKAKIASFGVILNVAEKMQRWETYSKAGPAPDGQVTRWHLIFDKAQRMDSVYTIETPDGSVYLF